MRSHTQQGENLHVRQADIYDRTFRLAAVRNQYGNAWQIGWQASPAAWFAERRRHPPLEVHFARTLPELQVKLSKATEDAPADGVGQAASTGPEIPWPDAWPDGGGQAARDGLRASSGHPWPDGGGQLATDGLRDATGHPRPDGGGQAHELGGGQLATDGLRHVTGHPRPDGGGGQVA